MLSLLNRKAIVGQSDEQERIVSKKRLWRIASILAIVLPTIIPLVLELNNADYNFVKVLPSISYSQAFIPLFCLLITSYIEIVCILSEKQNRDAPSYIFIGTIEMIVILVFMFITYDNCSLLRGCILILLSYIFTYKYCMDIIVFLSKHAKGVE